MNSNGSPTKISARDFYTEFRGHRVDHLEVLLAHVRDSFESVSILWTAGDSSLDNKYWFHDTVPAAPGAYQSILQPPRSKPDVTYWLNYFLSSSSSYHNNNCSPRQSSTSTMPSYATRYVAINGAVEASTLNLRSYTLLPQDVFVRDHLQENDILIVSVGGNDVALLPLPCTICSILCLMLVLPTTCIEQGCTCGTVPIDDTCCGFGPSLCSCLCACPPCLGYFRHLFGYRVQRYIERLTEKTKPAQILVCMIYFPDETVDEASWANTTLNALGYNRNPAKLQAFIRKIYTDVISTIRVPGSTVVPVPLYRVLQGRERDDYVARVEPSPTGGRKLAEFLLAYILDATPPGAGVDVPLNETTPSSLLIRERA
jgi:hypothetical protein